MDKRTLSVVKRTSVGKNSIKALRKEGFIPAVMYGHSGNVLLSVNESEFGKKFKVISENKIIDLKTENDVFHVLIKDFQEDVLKGVIEHIDFYEVEKGKELHTLVPVHLIGSSIGVRLGGSLEHVLHEIQVECLPKDIPSQIEVNIESIEIGQSIHVRDLPSIKGVKFLSNEDQVVAHVTKVGASKLSDDTEEGSEE